MWRDQQIVERALDLSLATYSQNKYILYKYSNQEVGLQTFKNSDATLKQGCIWNYHEETMYIAFKGTEMTSTEDWAVNLDIEMISHPNVKYWPSDVKFHKGFLDIATMCAKQLTQIIEKNRPQKIIVTGHSKGAAVSALVYLTLAAEKFAGKFPGISFHNITFALPMFANEALKKFIEEKSLKLDKEMFHFVVSEDIVPSMLLLGDVHKELPDLVKSYLNEATINKYVKDEKLKEVANRALAIFEEDGHFQFSVNACAPIGKYLYLEEDSYSELPNDALKIGKELAKSLEILGQISKSQVALAYTGFGSVFDVIKEKHSLDNYNIAIQNQNYLFERKVLLVTGYPYDTGKQVEILHKDGQPELCPSIQNYPLGLKLAMGGMLQDKVVICGGTTSGGPRGATNKCYQLCENGQWAPFGAGLNSVRYGGAAATVTIQGEEYLWITGGRDASNVNKGLATTELLSSSGNVKAGPNLHETRMDHGILVIDKHVMVIGGFTNGQHTDSVLIYNTDDFTRHEKGPSMNHDRTWFACSSMVSPAHDGRTVAVVAGSITGDGQDIAEILDFTMPGSVWELSEYYLSFLPTLICFNLIMEIGMYYIYHMGAIITRY